MIPKDKELIMRNEIPKLLYTLEELVDVLSLSRATINRLRSDGIFPTACLPTSSKALRWRAKDIEAWIDGLPREEVKEAEVSAYDPFNY